MRKVTLLIVFLLSFFIQVQAQTDTLYVIKRDTVRISPDTLIIKNYFTSTKMIVPKPVVKQDTAVVSADTLPKTIWTKKNKVGMNINEVAFVNWNAGGNNSISAITSAEFIRKYQGIRTLWNNTFNFRYGINSQEGQKLRKTEDAIAMVSTFGYRRTKGSHWYFSAKTSFNTQLSNGYRYPNRDNPISRFMAPGYFFLGAGSEYDSGSKDFNLYISPITQKSTFVLDQTLADNGAFGVEGAVYDSNGILIRHGKQVYTEVGFLLTNNFITPIYKNMKLSNKLTLYSDYLNSFGNMDVDWELNFDLTVNQYVKANIGTHFKYDNDVKFKEYVEADGTTVAYSPRLQFKQLLGVGIFYEF